MISRWVIDHGLAVVRDADLIRLKSTLIVRSNLFDGQLRPYVQEFKALVTTRQRVGVFNRQAAFCVPPKAVPDGRSRG